MSEDIRTRIDLEGLWGSETAEEEKEDGEENIPSIPPPKASTS